MSSFALVALIAVVAAPLKSASPPEYSLTQAYYYAVFAAVIYFFVATIMVVTVIGFYRGHYDEEFKLTVRRQSLMIQTSGFLLYLLLGALVYAHVEDWRYLDAIYWAHYTILTVGIGDFAPRTHGGRSLLFPFAIGGIVLFGLIICTIRSLVVDRGKVKLGAALVEKLRQKVLKRRTKNRSRVTIMASSSLSPTARKAESQSSRQEFELMRQIQNQAIQKRRWTSLLISALAWFVLWFVSASVFRNTEKSQSWSYFDSLYFAFTSLLTIGYGDFHPTSSAGKAFFVFWSLLAVPCLTILISNMGETIVENIRGILLWVGNVTIFPAEGGFKVSIKRAANRFAKGTMFEDGHQDIHYNSSPKSSASYAYGLFPPADRGIEGSKSRLPQHSRNDLHCLLIREIRMVITHVNRVPPKRYTFDEWSWYIRLLSKYESGSDLQKQPLEWPDAVGEPSAAAMVFGRSNDEQKNASDSWSWIGDHSPLMAEKGEPEWLLDKLLSMLERELWNEEMKS